jgi:hypothetical protein
VGVGLSLAAGGKDAGAARRDIQTYKGNVFFLSTSINAIFFCWPVTDDRKTVLVKTTCLTCIAVRKPSVTPSPRICVHWSIKHTAKFGLALTSHCVLRNIYLSMRGEGWRGGRLAMWVPTLHLLGVWVIPRNQSPRGHVYTNVRRFYAQNTRWSGIFHKYNAYHFPVVPNWNIGPLSGFLWSHIQIQTIGLLWRNDQPVA